MGVQLSSSGTRVGALAIVILNRTRQAAAEMRRQEWLDLEIGAEPEAVAAWEGALGGLKSAASTFEWVADGWICEHARARKHPPGRPGLGRCPVPAGKAMQP